MYLTIIFNLVLAVSAFSSGDRAHLDVRDNDKGSYSPCPDCPIFVYTSWRDLILHGDCRSSVQLTSSSGQTAEIRCNVEEGRKVFRFPPGIFEIDEQLLIPASCSIVGAASPNDMANPKKTPDWKGQTLFLATRGVNRYDMVYCHAKDMVTTRVGFVLSSKVTVKDISYQGVDTIRPDDNGALCGGGAFETKGCAENDCKVSQVNTGGSDGEGSMHVVIENVRINDFFFAEDQKKIGFPIPGNYDCKTDHWTEECCFCKPNGVRSTQVAVWVPESRNAEGTVDILIKHLVATSAQADGINLHGNIKGALVHDVYIENTGDDTLALWGAESFPEQITFANAVAVNPGIMRPNWYGNCVATYGLRSVIFANITCEAPTLEQPIPQPGGGEVNIDTSMFVFYTSFGGSYPSGNSIYIKGWNFKNLQGTGQVHRSRRFFEHLQAWKDGLDKGGEWDSSALLLARQEARGERDCMRRTEG
ncbi:unnamed protein product [Durusdinium trenchii]|uniref:Uncharacterized protein n=1 Tax=Durusdinium trenchii TaxID=1381693 RepID=A0ABP0Q930_9DINO